jgi:hypothetical protein
MKTMRILEKLLVMFFFLVVAGCSTSTPSPQYDSEKAKGTLVRALEAWKKNEIGLLAKGTPPLRFEDDDYRDGCRLVGFRLADEQLQLRQNSDIRVELSLIDRRNKPVSKSVNYQVSLEPALAVLRND